MGLYDTIVFDSLGDTEFQTKSLECQLSHYKIDARGVIKSRKFDRTEYRHRVIPDCTIEFIGLDMSRRQVGTAEIRDGFCRVISVQRGCKSTRIKLDVDPRYRATAEGLELIS